MRMKTLALVAVIAAVAPACASRGFVRTEVGSVDAKVETLSAAVDENDARTTENGERIGEVDRRAGEAIELARTAQNAADSAAGEARRVDGRVDAVASDLEATAAKLSRLILEVTLDAEQDSFAFGSASLPDEAMAQLDALVGTLRQSPDNVFLEIEGHTDATGPETLNMRLGMERAEAVKQYLYEHHQVPLHKMNVISYGEDRPVAPNDTSEGRAQNRRVVIRVLS